MVWSKGLMTVEIGRMTEPHPEQSLSGDDAIKPAIVATPFEQRADASALQVLDEETRDMLAAMSEIVVLPPHAVLYTKDSRADFVYNIIEGAVATCELFADGTRCISAFLFPHDLVGLSEHGRYVATAETLNDVRAYKIPIDGLASALRKDSELSVGLLLKVCHDLRDAQHHAIVASHNAAHRRIAGFLLWLNDALQIRDAGGEPSLPLSMSLSLPMARHDIADYLGLSVESVSRALHVLESDGAILRKGPRNIDIIDRDKLLALSVRQ